MDFMLKHFNIISLSKAIREAVICRLDFQLFFFSSPNKVWVFDTNRPKSSNIDRMNVEKTLEIYLGFQFPMSLTDGFAIK